MRHIYFLMLFFSVLSTYGQNIGSIDYSYTSKGGVYVYSSLKRKTTLISTKATDPYISPDGTKLAYTANSSKGDRQVEVIDLGTKQKTILHTNNNNCYAPVWSPDGQFIAYNAYINNTWFICVIDKDNRTPLVVTKMLNYGTGSFSPTWSYDSKKILVHNMDTVFVFTAKGNLVEKISVATFGDQSSITSSTKFMLTNDENKIVFDCSVDEPGFEEPPGAIFVFDRKTKTTKRLTPKGYWCFQPFLKGDRIYFSASKKNTKINNIYSMKSDGSDFKLELSNCSDFTAKLN